MSEVPPTSTSTAPPRVGFIGLGHQGLPIARRIAQAGMATSVWARRRATTDAIADLPVTIASSPAELGTRSDIVGLCLFDAAGIEEVMFGPAGLIEGLTAGAHVVVHSTIAPGEVRSIARRAGDAGITVLDAPVSGGPDAASAGSLVVMLGGSPAAVEHCRPVLATYADRLVHLGDVGAGQLAKLVHNVLVAANFALTADAFRLGSDLGVDVDGLAEVLRHGAARSFALESYVALGSVRALAETNAAPTLAKDVELIAQLAVQLDVGALLPAARHLFQLFAEPD